MNMNFKTFIFKLSGTWFRVHIGLCDAEPFHRLC